MVFGLRDEKNSLTSSDGTMGLPSPKEGNVFAGGQKRKRELTGKWSDRTKENRKVGWEPEGKEDNLYGVKERWRTCGILGGEEWE